jgi:hypothetical protein
MVEATPIWPKGVARPPLFGGLSGDKAPLWLMRVVRPPPCGQTGVAELRGVNLELVLDYWVIIGNRFRGPRLLNFNNRLQNQVPRLTGFYLVAWVKTGYPDWVVFFLK